MLSVANADLGDKDIDTDRNSSLKGLTRFRIRRYLKEIHPKINLYHIVSKLGLPFILQSYLLFDTIPKYYQDLNSNEREFLLKVSEGDFENASELIKRGVDVNVQNDNGMTALMIASEEAEVELLEELLKMGADVNIQKSVGDTALIISTIKGQYNCVKELLKFRADTSIQGKDGLTALMHAAIIDNIRYLGMLLDAGADPNVSNDDYTNSIIRVGGLNVHGCGIGTTAIIYAARHGKAGCVKKLIEAGADVNNTAQDNEREGNTPLMAAVISGNVQCVRELIQVGAHLNIPDKDGMTALMITSGFISHEIFLELMKAGAKVDTVFLAKIARKLLMAANRAGI